MPNKNIADTLFCWLKYTLQHSICGFMKNYSYSYKEFKGATNVQNRLDPSRDHSNGSSAQLCQICTDVQT